MGMATMGDGKLPLYLFEQVIKEANDAIIVASAETIDAPGPRIVYVNQAFTDITGYTSEEVIGGSPRILQGPGTDRRALDRIRAALAAGRDCREEILNYGKDGCAYWLDIHIVPLRGPSGRVEYFAAIERDVTAQRRRIESLWKLAHEDVLTGLGNRAAIKDRLVALTGEGGAGSSSANGGATHALVLFDLDGFKRLNDTWGHAAGDFILQRFAAVVVANLRRDDFVARIGGDEFAVVLPDSRPSDARMLAERIIRATKHFTAPGQKTTAGVGASAGVVTFRAGDRMEDILSRADAALYEVKRSGKGAVRVARPAIAA